MTHFRASIREKEEEKLGGQKLTCVLVFKVLRENNGSGLDIGGGGDSDLVWEGRRQLGVHGDGTREDSCQYPTTDP